MRENSNWLNSRNGVVVTLTSFSFHVFVVVHSDTGKLFEIQRVNCSVVPETKDWESAMRSGHDMVEKIGHESDGIDSIL